MKENQTEVIVMRLTPTEAQRLDEICALGDYKSRAMVARSIIRDVINDDALAHGEPGLPPIESCHGPH